MCYKKRIIYPGNTPPFTIIGIVRDFNYWSIRAAVEPMALFHIDNTIIGFYGKLFVAVRVEEKGLAQTMEKIRALWKSRNPGVTFSYEFTDDAFDSTFQSTEQFSKSLTVFAGLSLFIAGLGLLGMIIYAVEQRKKEIGIRKVLGSNSLQIVTIMSRRFVLLISLSLLLSIPMTYLAMNQWLLDFQYRVTISIWTFVGSGALTIMFAFCIVGFQSFKAAMMNPTRILRNE